MNENQYYKAFHEELYPTSDRIIEMMGVEPKGKRILEPSVGLGNIAKWLNENGAEKVYAYEIVPNLQKIASEHATIVGADFMDQPRRTSRV